MFAFDQFSVRDLSDLCKRISECTRGIETMESAATAVVHCLRDVFRTHRNGRSDITLARAFQTADTVSLTDDVLDYVHDRAGPGQPVARRHLVLLGTEGDHPDLCDRHLSRAQQAIPLLNPESIRSLPLVSGLFDGLGVDAAEIVAPRRPNVRRSGADLGVFFAADADASGYLPDSEFIPENEIKSVVGFGGLLPDGELFCIVMFTRVVISGDVADYFRTIAVAVRLALLAAAGGPLLAGQQSREMDKLALASARIAALEQLLGAHQNSVNVQAASLTEALQEALAANAQYSREVETNGVLHEMTTAMSGELDVRRLARAATDAITHITGASVGEFFYNVVEDEQSYRLHAVSGMPREGVAYYPEPQTTELERPSSDGTVVRSEASGVDLAWGEDPPYQGMSEGFPEVRSHLAVPVVSASGEFLGNFLLGHPDAGRFDARDERLAFELAAQVALTLDTASHAQAERATALGLRRRILPQTYVVPDGLDIAHEYVPAGHGAEVGGDWYDVIPLAPDRTAFVVGAVMGMGAGAAVVMAQIRGAIRALAIEDLPPAVLVERLNRLVVDMAEDRLATCVYSVLDQTEGVLTLASAGHVFPAIVHAGDQEPEEFRAGRPLGYPGAEHREYRIVFPVASRMLMFTDGLVEDRRRALDDGARSVSTQLRTLHGPCSVVCREMMASLRQGRRQESDITLLMVANRGMSRLQGTERVFEPQGASASAARRFVAETLHGWDDDEIADTVITVTNELVINAVTHAQTEITVRLRRLSGAVIAEIEDLDPREPRRHRATDQDVHFRGLHLVDALATRWGCRAATTGKFVWAEFAVDDEPESLRCGD